MTPTNRLRFVECEIESGRHGNYVAVVKVRILQQWWEPEYQEFNAGKNGEWRDVPLEVEE